jgi:predicted nuclease of restriction endonuclease-like RecB superfamily
MHAVDARKRLFPTKTSKSPQNNLNDRKVKLIEIAETLKISKKRVEHIVYEYLDMQKLCAKWLPHVLTIDQNQQRVDDSEQCLSIFNRKKYEFFRRYITMNVTWLLQNTPESNRQSAKWTERDEPNPKHGKTQRSAGTSITGCAW